MFKYILFISIFMTFLSPIQGMASESFFPKEQLPQFLAKNFDLNSIRSSFGPRNIEGKRNFLTDFYPNPTYLLDSLEVTSENWFYKLQVMEVKDFNNDGIIDIAVCFWDDSIDGTYNMSNPYLLTRYSNDSPVVAISYEIFLKNCPNTSEKE